MPEWLTLASVIMAIARMRTEQEVFDELAALCIQPGYVHAVCWFCFRDNIVKVGEKLEVKNLENLFGFDRLIRTEISTLIGLALKGPMDLALPAPKTLQEYLDRTEALLSDKGDEDKDKGKDKGDG